MFTKKTPKSMNVLCNLNDVSEAAKFSGSESYVAPQRLLVLVVFQTLIWTDYQQNCRLNPDFLKVENVPKLQCFLGLVYKKHSHAPIQLFQVLPAGMGVDVKEDIEAPRV